MLGLLVGSAIFWGPPVWEWLRTEERWQRTDFMDAPDTIWLSKLSRTTGKPVEGSTVEGWSAKTGIRVILWEDVVDGQYQQYTYWSSDGTIVRQAKSTSAGSTKFKKEPPWWGEKVEETVPSAPWLEAGFTADEWWDRVGSEAE